MPPDPAGNDPHRRSASLVYGVAEFEVTKEQRRVGKYLNCVAAYHGLTDAHPLAELLGVDISTAEVLVDLYRERVLGLTKEEDV